jgi:hypothetical protein
MALRGLKESDILYVYEYGTRFFATGAIHVFLGTKNIPGDDRKNDRINRLEGTTVLLNSYDRRTVITVYRNRESTKKDRRKAKYNSLKRACQLPLAI